MVIQDNKEAKRRREKKEWETDAVRREKWAKAQLGNTNQVEKDDKLLIEENKQE